MVEVSWVFLGNVPYRQALDLQYRYAQEVARGKPPKLFFLEHPNTVTLGRHANPDHLKLTKEEFAQRGVEVFETLRGGDVTFHGPGQLVGYPVASLEALRCSVPDWVMGFGRALVRFFSLYGIESRWSDEHPGVWVGQQKIAAVGFHLSHRISTHGFAINIDPDLSQFDMIVPCGLEQSQVTSMAQLHPPAPSLLACCHELVPLVSEAFGWTLVEDQAHDARIQ